MRQPAWKWKYISCSEETDTLRGDVEGEKRGWWGWEIKIIKSASQRRVQRKGRFFLVLSLPLMGEPLASHLNLHAIQLVLKRAQFLSRSLRKFWGLLGYFGALLWEALPWSTLVFIYIFPLAIIVAFRLSDYCLYLDKHSFNSYLVSKVIASFGQEICFWSRKCYFHNILL